MHSAFLPHSARHLSTLDVLTRYVLADWVHLRRREYQHLAWAFLLGAISLLGMGKERMGKEWEEVRVEDS